MTYHITADVDGKQETVTAESIAGADAYYSDFEDRRATNIAVRDDRRAYSALEWRAKVAGGD
jgi:hypothetical protein